VRPPTITKVVATLEKAGLVERETDSDDRRVVRVRSTARGVRLLQEGRQRRVAMLAGSLGDLSSADRALLERAALVLEKVVRGG
jgi:DNA-binding MarR family transcriptional regulator